MNRGVSKFLYHMVKTYYDRMYYYVLNASLVSVERRGDA